MERSLGQSVRRFPLEEMPEKVLEAGLRFRTPLIRRSREQVIDDVLRLGHQTEHLERFPEACVPLGRLLRPAIELQHASSSLLEAQLASRRDVLHFSNRASMSCQAFSLRVFSCSLASVPTQSMWKHRDP